MCSIYFLYPSASDALAPRYPYVAVASAPVGAVAAVEGGTDDPPRELWALTWLLWTSAGNAWFVHAVAFQAGVAIYKAAIVFSFAFPLALSVEFPTWTLQALQADQNYAIAVMLSIGIAGALLVPYTAVQTVILASALLLIIGVVLKNVQNLWQGETLKCTLSVCTALGTVVALAFFYPPGFLFPTHPGWLGGQDTFPEPTSV